MLNLFVNENIVDSLILAIDSMRVLVTLIVLCVVVSGAASALILLLATTNFESECRSKSKKEK